MASSAEDALQAPVTASTACAWCGAQVEGVGVVYCCHGCEAAADMVREAGLGRHFERREAPSPRPSGRSAGWEHLPVEQAADGDHVAQLRIDGLRCGSCVWLVERVLQGAPGVREVQVSYASGSCALRFDPTQTDLAQLAHRVEDLGYSPRPADSGVTPDRALLLRLGLAAFVAMNVMMSSVSVYLGWWSGMDPRFTALLQWTNLILATPVALWAAEPFFVAAWAGLRHRVLHMDLPVSVGVAILYGHGVFATFRGEDSYLDSLTMLVALLLGGRLLEQRGRTRAAEAASSLAARAPRSARRVGVEGPEDVAPSALVPGDVLEVALGEEIAADGLVTAGEASVGMALLTGESEPRAVRPGDRVVAGGVLIDGSLRVMVEAAGESTLLSRMATGLRGAQAKPTPPSLPDRIAPAFTAATLGVASATFAIGAATLGVHDTLPRVIAVLVVACPCALALAAPLAHAAGLGAAARRGLLFQGGAGLRRLAEVDLVAFDKTGTLTQGEPVVVEADDATLRLAAAVERQSLHPVARGIVAEAARRGLPIPLAQGVRELPGVGVEGVLDGQVIRVRRGGPGEVIVEGHGRITLRDVIRPDAARTVARLKALGLPVVLLTGDSAEVAARIGAEAGVDEVLAEQDPEAKLAALRRWQAEGRRVLFVGDGVNDGPALSEAHAGVAMGGGAASSVLIADAVVAREGLGPVLAGIFAARAAERAIRGNLMRSLAYNVGAVALAAAGLVNPLVAAVLMPLSSGLVIFGALRVERAVAKEL
ncbi:cadmium-translocating P-type ATPase [Myxococcota bacterium]|nr:cadmium-translocating P-type ATPase [Myxococcota bacterium]